MEKEILEFDGELCKVAEITEVRKSEVVRKREKLEAYKKDVSVAIETIKTEEKELIELESLIAAAEAKFPKQEPIEEQTDAAQSVVENENSEG